MAQGFQHFLNSAGKYPLLTHDQELMLGRQVQAWIELRDLDNLTPEQKRTTRMGERAYNKFFKSNLRLVISVSKKYAHLCNFHTMDDLIQEGCFGLSRAIEKFDPTRGYKFSTYAYWWIRQAITRSMTQTESHIRLPIACVETHKKLRAWIPSFVAEHRRYPNNDEMAEHCGINKPSLLNYLTHIKGVQSLNVKINHDGAEGTPLIDLIASPVSDPLEIAETSDAWEVVQESLKKLTERQRYSLSCHWGLEGLPQMTLKEIGESIGVSKEMIRAHERQAINKIRVLSGAEVTKVFAA